MPPFGIPRIVSLALWAGVYGAAFGAITRRIYAPLWLAGIGLGVFAALMSGLIVAVPKGQPLAYGGQVLGLVRSLLLNGFWGFGTGLILGLTGPVPQATELHEPDYAVRAEPNHVAALGLLKDWATSIIQLETAIVGAAGAAVIFKGSTSDLSLSALQGVSFVIAMVAFCISIFSSITLLNILPGAAERHAISDRAMRSDVYSIYTYGSMTIGDWAHNVRWSFVVAIVAMACFAVLRVLNA
jgi:hypothetical protein